MPSKSACLLLISVSASAFAAPTPDSVLAGKAVNSWMQAGVRATVRPFDLAIQGSGFFALQRDGASEMVFSRQGEMELDHEGYLVQKASKLRLLGYRDGALGPLHLADAGRDHALGTAAILLSFRVGLDGRIAAVYQDGHIIEVARIALALFANPRKLDRTSTHLLQATEDSGKPYLGVAQEDGRGSLYSSALEELDEADYAVSLDL